MHGFVRPLHRNLIASLHGVQLQRFISNAPASPSVASFIWLTTSMYFPCCWLQQSGLKDSHVTHHRRDHRITQVVEFVPRIPIHCGLACPSTFSMLPAARLPISSPASNALVPQHSDSFACVLSAPQLAVKPVERSCDIETCKSLLPFGPS